MEPSKSCSARLAPARPARDSGSRGSAGPAERGPARQQGGGVERHWFASAGEQFVRTASRAIASPASAHTVDATLICHIVESIIPWTTSAEANRSTAADINGPASDGPMNGTIASP